MTIRPVKRENVAVTGENLTSRRKRSKARKLIVALFIALEALFLGYTGISFFVAAEMAYAKPKAITETPAALGLNYRDVTFLSREDHLLLRGWFTPGVLFAMQTLYGINYNAVRPEDVVASIAPRPLFFIAGTSDGLVPPWNMNLLATAAKSAPDGHVQTWLVPGANHIQSFDVMGNVYVERVATFFTHVLGPATQ